MTLATHLDKLPAAGADAALNPKLQTLHPKPETPNPKPQTQIRKLLATGADSSLTDADGLTPAEIAVKAGRIHNRYERLGISVSLDASIADISEIAFKTGRIQNRYVWFRV